MHPLRSSGVTSHPKKTGGEGGRYEIIIWLANGGPGVVIARPGVLSYIYHHYHPHIKNDDDDQ